MIDHFIEEFQPGQQLLPMEWRPLVHKVLLWQVELMIWGMASMTVLCEVCGKAATLVMTDQVSAIEQVAVAVCVHCCYDAVSKAQVGKYRVAYIKGVTNGN